MTVKRFTLMSVVNFDYGINDNDEPIGSLSNICDLLNNLADENEQLKKDATTLIYTNQDYRRENEELKQQLNRLYNYFEDWYRDMTSANDFSEIWDNVKDDERWD